VVELAEMQDQRARNGRTLVRKEVNARAVVADRRFGIGARRREIGHRAAEAEADHADLDIALRQAPQMRNAGLHVLDAGRVVESLVQRTALGVPRAS
jgi:hypothetical protein